VTIDWTHFTPWASLYGGLLIGVASAVFILVSGRIAGISGIVGGALRARHGDRAWRIAFVSGLVVSPMIYGLFGSLPPVTISADYATLIAAGLLVGVGTRYGSGCTSGHGVCGLSRRSPRSLAAVVSFMVAGFVTVFIWRHLFG
jgi:uncharacterized membrane protein YedE/YeeE